MAARVRLYIETPLYGGRELDLDESRSHYLSNVMKLAAGDAFLGFDGRSGEFEMQIAAVSKKQAREQNVKQVHHRDAHGGNRGGNEELAVGAPHDAVVCHC